MWSLHNSQKKAEKQLLKMMNNSWQCASCGKTQAGLFDLAAFAPDFWNGEEVYAPNDQLCLDGDFLSEDFCVIDGENFFVRSVLLFPIKKIDMQFGFGAWSTLSKDNFKNYLKEFDAGNYEPDTAWTGWFSNEIKGVEDTIKQACVVVPQINRQRPLIYFQDDDHPVSIAQEQGLDAEWLLKIYAANGHQMK